MTLPHHWTFSMRSSAQPWISLHIYFISYSITKHSTLSGWLLRLKTMVEIPILKLWTKYATCSLVVICSAHHWSFLTAHPLLKVQPLPACVSTSFYSPLISLFFLLVVPTPNFLLSSQQSLLLVFNFPVAFPTLLGALIFLISLLPVIPPHMKTGSPQCEVHAVSISSHLLCVPWTDRCAKSGHQRGEKCSRPLLSKFRGLRITGRYWLTSNFDLVGVQWSPGLGIF